MKDKETKVRKEDATPKDGLQDDQEKGLIGDRPKEKQQEKLEESNIEKPSLNTIENKKEGEDEILAGDREPKSNWKMIWGNVRKYVEHTKVRVQEINKETAWKDSWIMTLFFVGCIIYLEFVLHLIVYKSVDSKIIFPILFALPIGTLCSFLSGFFRRKINTVITWSITAILCLIFSVQLIYQHVFKVFFSFQSIGMAGDAISEFYSDIWIAIKSNIFGMVLLILPLFMLAFLLKNVVKVEKRPMELQGILAGAVVLAHGLAVLSLLLYGKGSYTPYDLYHRDRVADLCGKQLGIITMTRFDLLDSIKGEDELVLTGGPIDWEEEQEPTLAPTPLPEKKPTEEPTKPNGTPTPTPLPTPTPIDTSPNIMDIDFAALAEKESNKTIRTLHNYFASVMPTNKNKYTGMFEGYNLIMITAEGFSPYAVHEEITPNLYRLVREGFVFTDFYTALWQTSTSDGEYVATTGLIPVGTRSMYHSRNNLLPFSLGHQFNKLGVKSKAYHNHTYTYYQRDETHPNLGYIYKGNGNGLVLKNPNVWPESDLEMIESTVDEYIKEDQFHVYYLTVSGHMNYTFMGNSMSYKNRDAVAHLPYSSDVRAYLACQMELEKALELLLNRLEEAGVADKTVIALSADHYPYGWEKEHIDEIAGYEVEPNFELLKNHFILWNSGMEETIIVDKPSSSLDILPTLSNLFGIEYDSRLLMGRDILSDADPLVILSNRSFITDKVKYNSETREIIPLTNETLPEDYVNNINQIIKNKFIVSESIVKEDYYRHVFPDIE